MACLLGLLDHCYRMESGLLACLASPLFPLDIVKFWLGFTPLLYWQS